MKYNVKIQFNQKSFRKNNNEIKSNGSTNIKDECSEYHFHLYLMRQIFPICIQHLFLEFYPLTDVNAKA